jgi:hypothetical protein
LRLVKKVEKIDLLASVAGMNGVPQYHAGISMGGLQASGWYQDSHSWGTAVTYVTKRTKTILVVRNDLWANMFTVSIPNSGYILYSDAGVTVDDYQVVRAEAGVLRTFEAKAYIKGLFGLGYAHELRSVRGYIFVTL